MSGLIIVGQVGRSLGFRAGGGGIIVQSSLPNSIRISKFHVMISQVPLRIVSEFHTERYFISHVLMVAVSLRCRAPESF